MLIEQECETKIRCPDCSKPMYELKGAVSPIYICSYCGASIDQKTVEQQKERQNQNNADGKQSLLRNLFSKQFMNKYTEFNDFSEFIDHCDFFTNSIGNISKEDFCNVSDRKINRYVREHTCFTTWDQMFEKAVEWYLKM